MYEAKIGRKAKNLYEAKICTKQKFARSKNLAKAENLHEAKIWRKAKNLHEAKISEEITHFAEISSENFVISLKMYSFAQKYCLKVVCKTDKTESVADKTEVALFKNK